ncbi:MAG: putative membrane protein SpoIIM required for sporulation [Candidatus Paceibacteria bacterium]
MSTSQNDKQQLQRLHALLTRARGPKLRKLDEQDLRALPRLYRFASSLYARLETQGNDLATLDQTRDLLRRAHATLYRGAGEEHLPWFRRLHRILMVESPRALRAEWKLFAWVLAAFYGLVVASYAAVSQNLELAFTLMAPEQIAAEISQLQATANGEPFRGNFTFGVGESPKVAGMIMAHNMGVSVLFFASGLVAPFFAYLLASNAVMVGTYTAVASHWDQGLAISSRLWCHGMLELQAIIIAGMAGLILIRAWVAPGPWSRQEAMRRESRPALYVLAPVFPMLFIAGLIEGFVTPHAPTSIRIATAVVTGLAFFAWLFFAGKQAAQTVAVADSGNES